MAKKLDDNEPVTFEEMLMANSIQLDVLAQLSINEEIISEQRFYDRLK